MIPKKITIGPFEYEIQFFDIEEEVDRKMFGSISTNTNVIRLAKNKKRQRVAVTLIHEIVHGIFYNAQKNDEFINGAAEDITDIIALGLTPVIKHNPDVWAFITDLILVDPDKLFDNVI